MRQPTTTPHDPQRNARGARLRVGVIVASFPLMAASPVPEAPAAGAAASALDGQLGLFRMDELRLATGRCRDCATIRQALWYFADEAIVTARPGVPVAGFARGVTAWDDLRQWAAAHPLDAKPEPPPLVWIGAPEIVRGAELSPDGATLVSPGARWSLALAPKIALNRSYYDRTSTAFFAGRRLTLRGEARDGTFTARTIWPDDFRLDRDAPLRPIASTPQALRALIRAELRGGAQSPFAAFTLWERTPGGARHWEGAPVLAAMLNGAQGDDDEAHAGHFALVTGSVRADGAIGDWIVNNFYTLDSESEKGILAAMVPLDGYLADLNSGQAWYRPSYLMVAILKRERAADRVQGALERTYNQFYRHQLVYRHTTMNCASISVDVLRTLGWDVPARGATSWLAGALGLPYFAVQNRSVAKAAASFDYLTEDQTRLLPAAAFEEIGADLLRLANGTLGRQPTPLEAALAQDVEAIVFLRVPQLPSSRAWGDFPVATPWEYRDRYPRDPAQAKIIPVPPRPFPDSLRDDDLLPAPHDRSEIAIAVWAILSVVGIPWLLWRGWRRARSPRRADAHSASAAAETGAEASRDAPTPR
jgi:hypothetical protein